MSRASGPTAETKDRILDAAEFLFTEHGIDDTSLRAITGAAGTNLASVNYHFGSKEGLVAAVLARRIGPVNAARLAKLDELEARGTPPSLEELLEAFLRPAFQLTADPDVRSVCMRLVGRLQSETNPTFRQMCEEQFGPVVERFFPAFARACPEIDQATSTWRIHFMIGALVHILADFFDLRRRSGGQCDPRDAEAATRQLIRFAAAGLRAPPVGDDAEVQR